MKKKIKLYQIDSFTEKLFAGNPAGVCMLDEWLSDAQMQNIAAENNLAETAFVVPKGEDFEIRWFTPNVEVDLCGHATLASGHVLFEYYNYNSPKINFYSHASGLLTVERENGYLALNFPADIYEKVETPRELIEAFKATPVETYKGKTDYLLIFASQEEIENFNPDMYLIASAGNRGVIVSAPGNSTDFVSRFFAPQVGINEDPVTGSAHTTLTPYWSKRTGKKLLTAKQLSKRGGDLICEFIGERVKIMGKAVTYSIGEIEL